MRLARLGAALWLGWTAGCADQRPVSEPAPAGGAVTTRAPVVTGAPPRGVRVDLGGQAHHVHGLVRQPDGSYRAMCADAPASSLRVREGVAR